GIRDFHVTGVQTCALPIYSGAEYVASGNVFEGEVKGADFQSNEVAHTGKYAVKTTNANSKVFQVNGLTGANAQDLSKDFRPGTRSEERRVGKEGRYGGTEK